MDIETLEREALGLPASKRAKLAYDLLSSLDSLSEREIADLWLQESSARAREILDGTVEPVPAEDVFREAESLFR